MSLDTESVSKPSSAQPLVSAIMPVRNEAAFIEQSLGAVLQQDYPHDRLEVLIADGMSHDGTRQVIDRLRSSHPDICVKVIDNPGRIVSTGLNAALAVGRGEIIVRVDGHTVVERDYVQRCVDALHRSGAENVGGAMKARGDSVLGRAIALATSSRFGVGGARFHYSQREEWVDTVYMGAWPREVFRRVGMFDEEMVRNQDDEFNYRLREKGGRILLSPEIKSLYYNRATAGSLWRQYFQYGFWKVRVMQKHPRQMRPRQFIPPVFVIALLGSLLSTIVFPHLYLAAFIVGSYGIASITASILSAREGNWQSLPALPFVFAILHLSYGTGFLIGLMRFWNRWRMSQTNARLRAGIRDADKYERV